ncbi:unnamed protein product [Calypogeia fissa]
MHSTEKQFQQQWQGQIELPVRPDDASPALPPAPKSSSDRSVLLGSEVPRSDNDGFGLTFEQHSNGIIHSRPSSLVTNGSGTFTGKVVEEVRPLLASPVLSGEEDGAQRNFSSLELESVGSRHPKQGASLRSAVFNLSTSIVGAGIMALPAAMRVLGLIPGIVIILLMGLFSEVSLEMLVRYTTQSKKWTYGGMVDEALGKSARVLAQIAIIVGNGGVLIVYMIIIGDVMAGSKDHTGLFEGWAGKRGWWTNRSLVLFVTMVFILAPLSSLKKIDSLEITSAISIALALLFVVISVGIALVKLVEGKLSAPRMFPSFASKKAILDLLTVIPIMTNAFVCQFNVPPIYYELRDRTATTMNKVGRISIGLCVAVYAATALSGYLLFGELTDSDVLSNFDTDLGIPHSRFWNDLIRVAYVVHLFFVFPVIHFPFRETVDSLLFPKAALPLPENNLRFGLLTLLLLTVIYAGSTLIPNIWVAFKFTGATTGLSVGFMFPALVAIRTKDGSKMEQKLAWVMLLMAVVVSVIGVTTQIYTTATDQ